MQEKKQVLSMTCQWYIIEKKGWIFSISIHVPGRADAGKLSAARLSCDKYGNKANGEDGYDKGKDEIAIHAYDNSQAKTKEHKEKNIVEG